jgi:hypothetical protein
MTTTNGTTGTKIDWPVVALIAVVGLIAIAALRVLGVEKADLAALSAEQWTMVAGVLGGFLGTCVVAFRGKVYERSAPSSAAGSPRRDREGSSQVGVLLWLALVGGLALLFTLPGCGVSALRVHAGVASAVGATIDGACDEVGTMRAAALEACAAAPTADADAACVAREQDRFDPVVGGCGAAATVHDEWADELVREVGRDDGWTWADGLDLATRALDAASRLLPDLERLGVHADLPPELAALVSRGAP